MRILQVNQINEVAETFGKELMRRGHVVSLYKPNLEGGLAPLPIKLSKMPRRLLDLYKIKNLLNQECFDLVHIHWASYGVIGLLSQIPFIVHCHGDDILKPSFRAVLPVIFKYAAAVLCITPDLMPYVNQLRSDTVFFPGPIDTERFRPLNIDISRPKDSWTILLFACLVPKKGLEISTKGIAQFIRRHPDVNVKLVDWGSEKEKYKLLYGDRFEFIPRVPPEMVHQLIQSTDVVVGQFLSGALGLSELQAMSCAKPVIASFLYNSAYPAPPPMYQAATAQEVDNQLENLYQHPEEGVALGKKAREWIINNHSVQVLGSRLETLYQAVVNDSLLVQKKRNKIVRIDVVQGDGQ